MRAFGVSAAAMIVALGLIGCKESTVNQDEAAQAVRSTEEQWNKDYAAKDLEKIVDHYADDAVLMAPGITPAIGKDAVRNIVKNMVTDPAIALHFKASKVEVAKSGDVAYTQGSYTMTMTDPQSKQVINDHGSYVTTYRHEPDGSWKAVADIATSEVPPATPAAAPMKP
jgi:uncharacterized protein (TIGR02246 family)